MQIKIRKYLDACRRNLFGIAVGFLLALVFQCYLHDDYEATVFKSLAATVQKRNHSPNQDSILGTAMRLTHNLLTTRSSLFGNGVAGQAEEYDGTLTDDLLAAKGACGSFSDVLAQLLQTLGYDVRIAQMKVGQRFGGHIVVEARTRHGWVVLDPKFDCCFRQPSGRLASFEEVSQHWSVFQRQTPAGYNPAYAYADARYTNWEKIPILLPALHKGLVLVLGETKTHDISVAPLLLRRYRFYGILLSALTILVIATRFPRIRRLPGAIINWAYIHRPRRFRGRSSSFPARTAVHSDKSFSCAYPSPSSWPEAESPASGPHYTDQATPAG